MSNTSRWAKETLFANTRKYIIEEGSLSSPSNIQLALTINKNLEMYGMSLDSSAIRALATQTPSEMTKTWSDLKSIVESVSGAEYFRGELFYPNFPEEVMSLSESELYLNSLFYYTFSQSNNETMLALAEELRENSVGHKTERLPLYTQFPTDLKIINKGTEEDLFALMNDRVHSLNVSEQQLKELLEFSNRYKNKFQEILGNDSKFQSKETKVKIAMILHNSGKDKDIKYLLKDSVDVLRFAAILSKGHGVEQNNVELKTNNHYKPIIFKLNKAEKRLIRNLLDNCKELYTDIWKQEKLFKSLMKALGTTEKDGCSERVIKAFDNLAHGDKLNADGTPIFNPNRDLPIAIKRMNGGSIKELESLAKQRPGVFLRSYISTVEQTKPEYRNDVINLIKHCDNSDSIPLKTMLTVKGKLDLLEKQIQSDTAPINIYKYGNTCYVKEGRETKLSLEDISRMKVILSETASKMVAGHQSLGKVYIDPDLSKIKAPGRELRHASGNSTLTQYSKIDLDKNKNLIILGARWEVAKNNPEDRHVDIDLSAHMYGADYSSKACVSFSNLRHPFAIHSGDYTHVGSCGSSTEAIMIDKEALRANGIRYVVAEVHCYNINSFKDTGNCKFVFEQKEGGIDDTCDSFSREMSDNEEHWYDDGQTGKVLFSGEVFEPSQLENCIDLTANTRTTAPLFYDVEEDRMYWLDCDIQHFNRVSVTENSHVMGRVVTEIELAHNNPYPDLHSLLECYCKYNGEITSDMTKADTVFVCNTVDREKENIREDARVVSSLELDLLSKEFCGNDVIKPVEKHETRSQSKPEHPLVLQLRYLKSKLSGQDIAHNIKQDNIGFFQNR